MAKPYNVMKKVYQTHTQIYVYSEPVKSERRMPGTPKPESLETRINEVIDLLNESDNPDVVQTLINHGIQLQYKKMDSIKRSASRTKKNFYDIVHSNEWQLFLNITLAPEHGRTYEDMTKYIDNFIKRQKRRNSNFKMIYIPEKHKDGAWHIHSLVGDNSLKLVGATNAKNGKDLYNNGRRVYNTPDWNYGFTNITKVASVFAASSYMTKYMSKTFVQSMEGKKKFRCTQNCNRPDKSESYMSETEIQDMIISDTANIINGTQNTFENPYNQSIVYTYSIPND